MDVQYIIKNGEPEWAVLPYDEFLLLIEKKGLCIDIQDSCSIKLVKNKGTKDRLPSEVVNALAEGNNPIKVWREFRGFTQQQLAEAAGLTLSSLSRIETGKRQCSVSILISIAKMLEVYLDELII